MFTIKRIAAIAAVAAAVLLPLPQAASAQALDIKEKCTGKTCIYYSGTGAGGFYAIASGKDFYGHVDLWGPGITFRNSPTATNPSTDAHGLGSGWVCARGWAHSGGQYIEMGWPCVHVD
ncbi:hypothetical protein DP939_08310 [Spongiactinospora rosea]|uniref:Peptidase inhibitor family I36 n=1 Tax=Spongiactinospora rosea TaxID=2248750 RepID=A0A366M4B9_9ACTN|nr:hypothetical protein [Spongiactinospora rosea]RBQ21046.1 hypothetical protein DP939_08310 [Spongiactinospora rosea]